MSRGGRLRPSLTQDGYGRVMKTLKTLAFGMTLAAGGVLAACSGTTTTPSLPAISLPPVSIDPSAAAGAVVAVLDEIDRQIDANQTATGLTVEEQTSLKDLVSQVRTAVQTGDLSAAKPTVDALSAKVTELDAKLGTDAGTQLKSAIDQLKTIVGG
jgi:ABC-type glycerol-3-phosphate transport system substrate-binding protein